MPLFCSRCGKENRNNAKFCSKCGENIQITLNTGPLQAGTVLENRYRVIKLIKAGGMGAVYKVRDEKLDRIWALKELLPAYGTAKEQEEAKKWFKREAKLLAGLDHGNLPTVSDYFISNGRYYLIMTFVEGKDMETILEEEGNPGISEERAVNTAKEVLELLDYLHSRTPPVIYRDIKPANIMIHKDGRVMLIDFGIARTIQQQGSRKTAIGTAGYAPVEQCRGQAEPRSDLYALGATMHHLITGIEPLPFRFEPVRKINPNISQELEEVIIKSLKDKAEERYNSAKEMLEALTYKKTKKSKEDCKKNYTGHDWHREGNILYKQRKYSEAIAYFDRAIKLIPGYSLFWNSKGMALYEMKQYDEAILCYDRAIELDPMSSESWYNKGALFHEQALYDRAINCYDRAIELDPSLPGPWNGKGFTLEKKGAFGEAIFCYDKAIKADQDFVFAWNNKGYALNRFKEYDEAIICFDRALEIDPEFSGAWNNKGYTLDNMERHGEALTCYDKALLLNLTMMKVSIIKATLCINYLCLKKLLNATTGHSA